MKLVKSLEGVTVISQIEKAHSASTLDSQQTTLTAQMTTSTTQQTSLRHRVLSPNEGTLGTDFYTQRHGTDARTPLNNTALRQAERKYKREQFDDVLDFNNPQILDDSRVSVKGHYGSRPIYEIEGYEGFLYIPGALQEEQQLYWARRAIESYINPPNFSSLDALYEFHEFKGYSQHLLGKDPLKLTRKQNEEEIILSTPEEIESFARKLRWTTLGYQYDWSTKTYNFDPASVIPFPIDLAEWSSTFALELGFPDFRAEAGIVNYYQPHDSLTSHVDRSELNMQAPLLSMSLGLDAIFVLGGLVREDAVIGIRVKSGDISVLSGKSRLFYHGVPKIIKGTGPECLNDITLMKEARININIRQVT